MPDPYAEIRKLAEHRAQVGVVETKWDVEDFAASDDIRTLARFVLAALPVVEAHAKLVGDVDALIAESAGVDGLHLNGEVAGWDTLVRHGRYEEWLMSLDDGRDALAHLEEVTRA